jgi:diguanylate cyclase (GGDEF)-like protein
MSAERKPGRPTEYETLARHDLERAEAALVAAEFNAKAETLLSIDTVAARKLAAATHGFAKRYRLPEEAARSRFLEGTATSFLTEFALALKILAAAAEEAEEAGEIELANRSRNGIAIIYERMGEYGQACEMLHQCVSLARVTQDPRSECRSLSNLGTLHSNMGDYERAVSFLQEATDRAVGFDDPLLQLNIRATLAEALVGWGRFEEGLQICRSCQTDALAHNYLLQWGFISAIAAAAQIGLADYAGAKATLLETRALAEELGERDLLCDVMLKLIEVAQLSKTNPSDAELAEVLDLCEQIHIRQFEMRAHQLIARSHADRGQWQQAFEHRSRELELSNELKERNVTRKAQVLAVEMSVEQHRRRAEEEKKRSAELADLNEKLTETLARAEHYASHDSLTELLNRRKFLDLTEESVLRAERSGEILGLAFVDLDGFKLINDSLGHDVGDALLIQVARRLKGAVRGCDLVARAGGDEFMVLIRELTSAEEIEQAVARIAAVFDESFNLHGEQRRATGSVGHAIYPVDGDSVTALRIAADRAMYSEKRRRQAA